MVLFTVLPDLARQFYEAWSAGDVSTHVCGPLRDAGHPQARLLAALMAKHSSIVIEDTHVCTKTSKVVVEVHGATKAMHSLTFTEDGLVSHFVPYELCEGTSAC